MKNLLTLLLASSLVLAGCVTATSHDNENMPAETAMNDSPIAQAEADVNALISAGAQWRIIDKATGGKAVDMSKLIEVAKEKADAGETEEANRIAMHVSEVAKMAMDQNKRYAGSMPYYN